MFCDLDGQVDMARPKSTLVHTLRELAPIVEYESDTEPADSVTGEKRKMNGTSDRRPRKKARFTTQYPTPLADEKDDVSRLWWGAVQSDHLLGNGLPAIPFGPSSSKRLKPPSSKKKKSSKRIPAPPQNSKSLLNMMNSNIKTMRRLRHTHAKFAAMNATTAPQEDDEQMGEAAMYGAGATASGSKAPGVAALSTWDDDPMDDKIDESPWVVGRGRAKNPSKLSGIEMGSANASDCLHWATDKILEHSGFQGLYHSIYDSICLFILHD